MKPDDIPQDVWEESEIVATAIHTSAMRAWVPERSIPIIARALLSAKREGMEEAAKVVEGEHYHERYRTWEFWPEDVIGHRGNVSDDSELAKHCDKIAAAIRDKVQEVEP